MKSLSRSRFPVGVWLVLVGLVGAADLTGDVDVDSAAEEPPFVPQPTDAVVPLPSARIVGGRTASQAQFPHQVSLRLRDSHVCGGAIVSRSFVLTAAHCVTSSRNGIYPAARLSVRAGSNVVNAGGTVAQVAAVTRHPGYRGGFSNDIALLRLASPLPLGPSIRPITLASGELAPGTSVVISGWGRLRSNGATPSQLQFNTLTVLGNAECRRRIGNVPNSLLCLAHSSGNGACQGDSGGPAVVNGQLVGVANFVIGSCGTSAPDGYAKVASFGTWIRQNSDL